MSVSELITALTAIGALIFTGLSLNATRDQVAAAQQQSKIAEQGHYTDRYTKAVELLDKAGPDHLQGRLGAIYALEGVARESPRPHDQATIIEILSAFVRTNRPVPSANSPCPSTRALTTDVRAALKVLGRRDYSRDKGARTDLAGICLNGLNLSGASLKGADLSSTQLFGANLTSADLTDADLSRADLSGTNLTGSRHSAATLVKEATTDSNTVGKWW